jgi:hypothetical protein
LNASSASQQISINNLNTTTASLLVETANLEAFSASTLVSISNLNVSSASQQTSINALNAATSSYVTSAITASSLVTASFSGNTLTFTKGDASTFGVVIPDVSGSTINTGSFATTGSNAFIGNQTIAGGLIVSSSTQPVSITGSSFKVDTFDGGGPIIFRPGTSIQFQGNTDFTGPIRTTVVNVDNLANNGFYGFNNEVDGRIYQDFSGSVDSRINAIVTGTGFATTGSNTFTGNQNIQGTLTASLAEGYVWVGNGSNISTLVATSSFSGGGGSGSVPDGTVSSSAQILNYGIFATTGSNTFTGNQTISTAGNTQLNLVAQPGLQTNIEFQSENSNFKAYGDFRINNNGEVGGGGSGSIKFTTSNNFMELAADGGIKIGATNGVGNGIDAGNVTMQVRSGSLSLAPVGFNNTTASLLHLSSSSNTNFVNLIFKNSNTASDTVISGSNNIFANQAAPTAGFKRYMTGGNIGIAANGAGMPQVTGSLTFSPTISSNYFGVTATPLQYRGPVSSSAVTITNNVLAGGQVLFGSSAANNFEKAVSGLSFTNNVVNSSGVTIVAYKTPLSGGVSITNNNIGGTLALNMDSSSINLNSAIVQGQLTVNNSYFPSTYAANTANIGISSFLNIGPANIIYASGSNATFPSSRTIGAGSGIIGSSNVMSASLNGDNTNLICTTLLGQGLVAVGTNTRQAGPTMPDYGTVFVGRFNSIDGTKDQTAETVFAVGTGTAEASRKTAFLIDSGSNTFVEGTLNVSGSTSMTGSLTIQSGSGDLFMYGHKMFNVGAFYSTVTQSGSAAVSQSMTFNTTDISQGVSLNGGGTQMIVANGGTYNIQFSAQLLADTGADDVYIWLKKNGTNISNTAGRVTLANNDELMAAWNYVVEANASDYFELVFQSTGGDAVLLSNPATGNIPGIPSIIATVTQVR